MFRKDHPIAWAYHRRTSRFPFNMHGLNAPTHETPQFKEDLEAETADLPEPELPGAPLGDVLRRRSSCRQFAAEPIGAGALGNLLHAAYGVLGTYDLWGELCERPVPSGGGLYPLEIYVLVQRVVGLRGGVHHYVPLGHRLEVVRPDPLPTILTAEMFLGQPYLIGAAALVVITGVIERSLWKYEDRGYRYILLEAGHVAQNLNLCAEAQGLGSLNLGGFFDQDLVGLLKLDAEREIVLYGVAVGKPSNGDRVAATPARGGRGISAVLSGGCQSRSVEALAHAGSVLERGGEQVQEEAAPYLQSAVLWLAVSMAATRQRAVHGVVLDGSILPAPLSRSRQPLTGQRRRAGVSGNRTLYYVVAADDLHVAHDVELCGITEVQIGEVGPRRERLQEESRLQENQ
jgi:SagB-type dehydrogenase family enzyme